MSSYKVTFKVSYITRDSSREWPYGSDITIFSDTVTSAEQKALEVLPKPTGNRTRYVLSPKSIEEQS